MQDALRDTEDHDIGSAISHFFNCFVGKVQSASAKGAANNTQSKNQKKVRSLYLAKGCLPSNLICNVNALLS